MGENIKDLQRIAVSALCSWCGLIKVGKCWVEDNRNRVVHSCAKGTCPVCQKMGIVNFPLRFGGNGQ